MNTDDGINRATILGRQPPLVQSFGVLPEPDGRTAQLRIEFSKSVQLPREYTLQFDKAQTTVRPSRDNTVTTRIEFDMDAFLKRQAERAELARRGALVPVFTGRHFITFEQVKSIDPEQMRTAIQRKRFIRIPFGVLAGISATVDPSRELMITDLSVVEDKSRTFDVCSGAGTPMGAWTFGKLLEDMANRMIDPAEMVERWLDLWLIDQKVNSFKVPARVQMQDLLLNNWPRLSDGRLDLAQAPMRLLAIVNRLDLRMNPIYGGSSGEARFVFGVIDRNSCQSPAPFTVILEYGVPRSGCTAVHDWARQWHNLGSIALGTPAFNDALQKITDEFARPNAVPGKPNGTALNQLRTNENALGRPWELRQFHLDGTTHRFVEAMVDQTAALKFNFTKTLKDYIDKNLQAIQSHTYQVPPAFWGQPFRGGNAPNDSPMFWNSTPAASSNDARHLFSQTTCNGCHGLETDTPFAHINNRQTGSPSKLSKFLLGMGTLGAPGVHQVTDPVVSKQVWWDGDLLRRQHDLAVVLESSCPDGGFLSAIAFQPLNAPH
jgi:hypothetical protein